MSYDENKKAKEQQPSSEEKLSYEEQLTRKLREALDADGPEPDFLKNIGPIETPPAAFFIRESRRRTRRKWTIRALAFLLLIGLGAIFAVEYIGEPISADKQSLQDRLETSEKSFQGTDTQGLGDVDKNDVFEIIDVEKIPVMQEQFPDLCIPGYLTEGYTFRSLTVVVWQDGGFTAAYQYFCEDNQIILRQFWMEQDRGGMGTYRTVEGEKWRDGTLYYEERALEETNILTFILGEGKEFKVSGNLSREELEKIMIDFSGK